MRKPVKTVHFDYFDHSDELCKGSQGENDKGKLTFKKSLVYHIIRMRKNRLNPYEFTYHANNPNYNSRHTDRWGLYKNPSANPGQMDNADYPYSTQSESHSR